MEGTVSEPIRVQLKLYASLGSYLPAGAERNVAEVQVAAGTTITELLAAHRVPTEMCHLVLLNGVFQAPAVRASKALTANDAVAVWPPVAGG